MTVTWSGDVQKELIIQIFREVSGLLPAIDFIPSLFP